MNTLIIYFTKSILISGVLTSFYWLVLRNRKMHHYNRFFLLLTLACSLLLPLCHFNWLTVSPDLTKKIPVGTLLLQTSNEAAIPITEVAQHSGPKVDWALLLLLTCCAVSVLLMLRVLLRAISVFRLRRKYTLAQADGYCLVHTNLPQAPFSFLTYVFWNDSISLESETGQVILRHELVHVRQKHTYDKLASQLVAATFWMNPFFRIICRELNMVHEFLADSGTMPLTDLSAFARMLLRTHRGSAFITPEHQFFSSPIKRRLTMLQTNKTRYSALRGMLVLPLLAGLFILFSFTAAKKASPIRAAKKLTIVVDAGHGGMDAGATYAGMLEKDLNLRVALRIRELAPDYNIETHLTRTGDEYPPLAQRVEFANSLHPDAMISVHVNDIKANTGGSFDVIVNMDNRQAEKSRVLGWAVYQQLQSAGCTLRKSHLSNERPYVCSHSTSPTILLELGDIKRSADVAMLTDDTRLDNICNAILKGIVESTKN